MALTEQGTPPANLVDPLPRARASEGELVQLLADGNSSLSTQTFKQENKAGT